MTNADYTFTLIMLGSLLLIVFVFAMGAFIYINKQRLQSQQMKMQEAVLKARIEVQEQSLQSVSMEVHDNVGQTMSMVKMMLASAIESEKEDSKTKKFTGQAFELLSRAITDLRNLAGTLGGKTIEQRGLVEAIEEELTYIRSVYSLQCDFKYPEDTKMKIISSFQGLLIFRIVQESLQNIVRHAKARAVWITIEISTDIFHLSVRDNGIGIIKREWQDGGLGLIHMHERARLLNNASLQVNSQPGDGSEIILKMKMIGNDKKDQSSHS